MQPHAAKFIYLIGLAGTGKLTIAKAIQRRFDCLLFDNHLINNVVLSLIDPDGVTPIPEPVWDDVVAIRSIALGVIRQHSRPGRSFVFTNELLQGNERHETYFREVEALAAERQASLVPVRLLVSGDELARRVASPGRAEMYKDTNVEFARSRPDACALLQPKNVTCLDLDVTGLSAEQAAAAIVLHVRAGG